MKYAPSSTFRRLCLALALLAVTWAFPGSAHADFYPLQTVKTIEDTLKPNVLIVLETPQSMQGLPGENQARYNEVGADCEDGNRFCRMVGQNGRWEFSGMGKSGMLFGNVPSACLTTTSITVPTTIQTTINTNTPTTVQTSTSSGVTGTGSASDTATALASQTATGSGTSTSSGTSNATGNGVGTWTVTQSSTTVVSTTKAASSSTASGVSNVESGTNTAVGSLVTTSSGTVTVTGTATVAKTKTLTGTVTGTATVTESGTLTLTGTTTNTATVTVTGSVTSTGTITGNATGLSGTGTGSKTLTLTLWVSGTNVGTVTAQATGTQSTTLSKSGTQTGNIVGTASTTALGTGQVTRTVSATGTTSNTASATTTGTATSSGSYTGTGTKTAVVTGGGTATTNTITTNPGGTATVTGGATVTGTGKGSLNWTASQTGVTYQSNSTATSVTASNVAVQAGAMTGNGTGTVAVTLTDTSTQTKAATVTVNTTAVGTHGQVVNNGTYTGTKTPTGTGNVRTFTGTAIWTSTDTNYFNIASNVSWTSTGTSSGTVTYSSSTACATTTITQTGTASAIVTGSATVTEPSVQVSGVATVTGTGTVTVSGSVCNTESETATAQLVWNPTQPVTNTATMTACATVTATVTASFSSASTTTYQTTTNTTTATSYTTTTPTTTSITTVTSTCGLVGNTDPVPCTGSPDPGIGYCNVSSLSICAAESACLSTKGDFCRYISSLDGSGRQHADYCVPSAPTWSSGSCKHGVTTANTPCSSWTATNCTSPLGDFCAEGQPAHMCADSGLWCQSDSDCPGNATTDICVGATSRLMTVKRALRRAIGDYADKVNFGFMNSYQGRAIPSTATDASTAIFPYVKVPCTGTTSVSETKFLPRGELERAGCFSLSTGPASTCTIDYGGAGAINPGNAGANQITYTLVTTVLDGKNDSVWDIPRTDGSGKLTHKSANWSDCASSAILPACKFTDGTGLYEGSYYKFKDPYAQGTPVTSGDGSVAQPHYFTTYRGKFYTDTDGTCYNAIDAERTEIVNDGVFNRTPYTLAGAATSPYTVTTTGTGTATGTAVAIDTNKETSIPTPPWTGAPNGTSCTTGAIWNPAVVPFMNVSLTDTSTATSTATFTFNGTTVSTSQRALMLAGRLDKASFGGVYATGSVEPAACSLDDASNYMTTVHSNDVSNNGNHSPCWSNNIILVVDGQPNGPGDSDTNGTINCASDQCAYDAASNPNLTDCNCAAITKAFTLAQSGIQTHVVVNAPDSANDSLSWKTRYPYTRAFLMNLALAGSPNHDGVASFGTTEDEVYKAISDKIAAATYNFMYTTTAAVAGATTQDPTTGVYTYSNILYDTSVSYPSWAGNVRAFNTTSTVGWVWDAVNTATIQHHPAAWDLRRIYFSDASGGVHPVFAGGNIDGGALSSAGLGVNSTEATLIMQWLLGKPGLGNPAPVMGSTTWSTPIVVGQGAPNGLNGSTQYSAATWKRPPLVYVGDDNGMLHAFFAFADKEKITLGGHDDYYPGEEAFAFIPNDMLPSINKLYAQRGQALSVDKSQHIFGLASSPKVKDMCIDGTGTSPDSSCANSTGGSWRTMLVMPEGMGGNKPFALDITHVVGDDTTALHPENMILRWSAALRSDSATWDQALGETTSVPAFYFAGYGGTNGADNRVLFASGYPTKTRTGSYLNQGLTLLNADAATGQVKETKVIAAPQSPACAQTHAVLGDVAVARDYSSAATSQNLMAAYVADTWGNTFQYVPGALSLLYSLGSDANKKCDQPIYFSPAVVQLDRAPKGFQEASAKHFVYLVQVTGSDLDPLTTGVSSSYPPSQLAVTKVDGNVNPPQIDTSYNKLAGTGTLLLTAGTDICLQSLNPDGTTIAFTNSLKTSTQTCGAAGGTILPATARPVGTPTITLRSDALGFQAITGWYDPTAMSNNCSSGGFSYGRSYVTVHEFGADGTWYQIAGLTLNKTALTGITFVGTGLFIDGIIGDGTPPSISIGETFSRTQQVSNNAGPDRYQRTSWTERVDL